MPSSPGRWRSDLVLQWVMDAYNVVYASTIYWWRVATGWLTAPGSIGIATFCVGSLVCGVASTPQVLIWWSAELELALPWRCPGVAVLSAAYPDAC